MYSFDTLKPRILTRLLNKNAFHEWFYFIDDNNIIVDMFEFEKFCYDLHHTFITSKCVIIFEKLYIMKDCSHLLEKKKKLQLYYKNIFDLSKEFTEDPLPKIDDIWNFDYQIDNAEHKMQFYDYVQSFTNKKKYIVFEDKYFDYNYKIEKNIFTEFTAFPIHPDHVFCKILFRLNRCFPVHTQNIQTILEKFSEKGKETKTKDYQVIYTHDYFNIKKQNLFCIFVNISYEKRKRTEAPNTFISAFLISLNKEIIKHKINHVNYLFIVPDHIYSQFKDHEFYKIFISNKTSRVISTLQLLYDTEYNIYNPQTFENISIQNLPNLINYSDTNMKLPNIKSDDIYILYKGLSQQHNEDNFVFVRNDIDTYKEVFYLHIHK
jgi:hypothetical protein